MLYVWAPHDGNNLTLTARIILNSRPVTTHLLLRSCLKMLIEHSPVCTEPHVLSTELQKTCHYYLIEVSTWDQTFFAISIVEGLT